MSMPILSAFIVGLFFNNVDSRAMILAVVFGVCLYAIFTFVKAPFGLHYIHLMCITLIASVLAGLIMNRVIFGKVAGWDAKTVFGKPADA